MIAASDPSGARYALSMVRANGGHCSVPGAGSTQLRRADHRAEHQVGPARAVEKLDPLLDELVLRRQSRLQDRLPLAVDPFLQGQLVDPQPAWAGSRAA